MSARDRRYSAHIGYLFTDIPFEQRFAAARRNGFAAVEHSDTYTTPAPEISLHLAENQLAFAWINLPSGDLSKGERGFACWPDRSRFMASLQIGLDYAEVIGCPLIHPMAGIRPEGIADAALWETYLENMALAADEAAKRGLTVVVEPLGEAAIPNYFMGSTALAARLASELGRSNVGVLLDIYHTINCGEDPFAFIKAHGDLVTHVHLADHPGRHEPGTGKVDFDRLYRLLDRAGYDGFYGCEYVPAGETEAGLGWKARAGVIA